MKTIYLLAFLLSVTQIGVSQHYKSKNLALDSNDALVKSWEPALHTVPEHEPYMANDGTTHTYWAINSNDLPGDLGVEWKQPQNISSLAIRYFDGRMVQGPISERIQESARV